MPPKKFKFPTQHCVALALILTLCSCATSSNKKPGESSDVYLQLGVRYLSLNKLEIAKENLQMAVKKDPGNAQAHDALAYLYEKLNADDQAKDHYQKALSLAPDDLSIKNNYGRFLCDHESYDTGISLLTQSFSSPLNSQPWLALTNAGRCQLAIKQPQQAEELFRQALQLNSSYAPALQEMQKISFQKGEFWPAKGFLQRYLNVASHTPQTLWIAVQTEMALGNQKQAEEYKQLLLQTFPISSEAKLLKSALP